MAKILVVEDEKPLLDDIVDLLMLEDHDVLAASNGKEGLALAKAQMPDLIISDVTMPIMDGFEMVRGLKRNQSTNTIPILFLTAKVERSDIRRGMQLGADDYLTKPFTTTELLQVIQTLLKKQDIIEERYVAPLRQIQDAIAHSLPHEFRTPLYAVIASGELLSMDAQNLTPAQIKELGESVLSSGLRLQRVIEHYLMFAQMEITESSPEKLRALRRETTPYPKGPIKDLIEDIGIHSGRLADIDLALQHNQELQIEPHYFSKTVAELLENAVKFSEPGQTIQVRDEVKEGLYTLTIEDRGRGMTADEIKAVGKFRQFRRGELEQQGIGMGLALASKIARLFEGNVILTPATPQGLVQQLVIPIVEPAEPPAS